MERAVRESDFVIVICTPNFKEKSDGRGGGVGYEGDILTAYAFKGEDRRKFIPVLRRGSWSEAAPAWLLGRAHIDLSSDPYSESEYEELLRTLHGAREEAPPIGPRPDLGDEKGSLASPAPPGGSPACETVRASTSIVDHIPNAFMSYSWDDDAHKEWVRQLAIRLRADGVDVTLDRWHSAPGDQIAAFMERAVRENDFVIAVCTPRFKERSDRRGGGVAYEGDIMTAYAFKGGDKRKFIPVLRRGSWTEAAPTWLLGRAKIDLSRDPYSESEYEELLRTLHGAREEAPPIGHRPNFGDKKGSQASPAPAPVTPQSSTAPPAEPSNVLGDYYRKERPLNEAKLIVVGRGGVGKTCLVKRLVSDEFNPREVRTDGIRITDWDIRLFTGEEVQLHVWDFGGQEIMHATHQFFLTERSLYLLALSGREGSEDLDAEYWLRMARSFGGDAPVIVVLNKIKETHFDVNRTELRSKHPSIVAFIKTDCRDGTGIETLRETVRRQTDGLENLRVAFPHEWFAIKSALPRQGRNYLTFDGFRSFCKARGVTSEDDQDRLARYLHDLGVMLNYRDDDRLRGHFVLNPHWVTTGVYKIINADVLARNRGLLRLRELAHILDPVAYPREMHRFLLDLMKRFELCFARPGESEDYLVPQLLDKDQQAELPEFESEGGLRFRYFYPVIPEGLIPRFIVRTYTLSESQPRWRWRTGVVLEFESHCALVKADRESNTVEIDVRGPTASGRRDLLAIIRSNFAEIHPSNLKPEAMVPVPGHPEVAIPYEELRVREMTGRRKFDRVVGATVIDLDASNLLDGVDTEAQARSRTVDSARACPRTSPPGWRRCACS